MSQAVARLPELSENYSITDKQAARY